MDNNSTSSGMMNSTAGYEAALIVSSVILIIFIAVGCYLGLCADRLERQLHATRRQGIFEAALLNCSKIVYTRAKLERGADLTGSSCSICLVDYNDSDVLRLLPSCGHLFHVECVDPWFRMQSTCPICRNSPVSVLHISTFEEYRIG